MNELSDLELEQVSAGAEFGAKLPLLIPVILPILFPKNVVAEARVKLAALRARK